LGPHCFSAGLLHHLVINEPLADMPDLNVTVIGFPELALFELRLWFLAFLHFHSNQTIAGLVLFIPTPEHIPPKRP